ncbi:MAG: NAD(P)H-hydrate dehydratase [Pararhodobacter sp.]
MTEILTSAQMRAVERAAIESGRASGLELMERAGAGVVEAIEERWPTAERRAVVLCGPGNNGGDGYVVARLLAGRGWQVAVHALAAPVTEDAAANAARWGGGSGALDTLEPGALEGAVVVDALFGTGLTRPVAPPVWGVLALARQAGARLVAVDILSGLCADTGRVRAEGVPLNAGAALTVTFQVPKPGHFLLPGAGLSGDLAVVDIGLADQVAALCQGEGGGAIVREVGAPGFRLDKAGGHKFEHGHALVLCGGVGQGGAGRLAARAALRIGAGLVTLGCPPAAVIENAARLDAVMLAPIKQADALISLLERRRVAVLCLGPGLGLGVREAALVGAALQSRVPCVLDADALSLIARDASLRAAVHRDCVLTPHAGEFARLWPDLARKLANGTLSKVDAVVQAAAEIGATVLLKGADTVIAEPEGRPRIHAALRARAMPWLATAGAGDVLAGLIAGLLARGWAGGDAAAAASWLHVECARAIGPGLIAEDLPEALPAVLRAQLR